VSANGDDYFLRSLRTVEPGKPGGERGQGPCDSLALVQIADGLMIRLEIHVTLIFLSVRCPDGLLEIHVTLIFLSVRGDGLLILVYFQLFTIVTESVRLIRPT
jgi:hypothetical protein